MNRLLQYRVRAGDTKARTLHCPTHWACVPVACMPTSCPRQYLWGHNISYIRHAIMLIARYLVLTCPCTCSAAHTMLLLHLTSYSHVRLFCLVYKWCDVHPNVIVVLCLHSCVPACLQNVPLFLRLRATLVEWPRDFPTPLATSLVFALAAFSLVFPLLPTKTSRVWAQLWGRSAVRRRVGSQVSFSRWSDFSSRLTLVAIILSSMSRALIILSHRVWISSFVWMRSLTSPSSSSLTWMTLSHLRTHIRCMASDIRIWRRRSAPR